MHTWRGLRSEGFIGLIRGGGCGARDASAQPSNLSSRGAGPLTPDRKAGRSSPSGCTGRAAAAGCCRASCSCAGCCAGCCGRAVGRAVERAVGGGVAELQLREQPPVVEPRARVLGLAGGIRRVHKRSSHRWLNHALESSGWRGGFVGLVGFIRGLLRMQ
jgi:hypothetical protein